MNFADLKKAARFIAALAAAALFAPPALAEDKWSEPFRGVRYLHRTTDNPRFSIHIALIDLTDPGIGITATPSEDRGTTVSTFARKKKVQVAVNGDFFKPQENHKTYGLAIGEGRAWPDSADTPNHCLFAAGAGNRVEIYPREVVVRPERWMQSAIGGNDMRIRDGAPYEGDGTRHPRTGLGLSKDKKTLMLFVVDGRQAHSIGMNSIDQQQIFLEFGCWTAINFDGGGSTTMYLEGPGVVNRPSDGRERLDANHLGFFAATGRSTPKGQIRGIVREKGTGKPLPGAKVSVGRALSDSTHTNGFYHLSQVPAGTATLTASLDGYAAVRLPVKVVANQPVAADVELAPASVAGATAAATATRTPPPAFAADHAPLAARPPPSVGAEGETERLLTRAQNYEKSRLWGKAQDIYQSVVKLHPGTVFAQTAQDGIRRVEVAAGR